MSAERRARDLGLEIPDFSQGSYVGTRDTWIRPWRIHRGVLYLEGHAPVRRGEVVHPGRLGRDVTLEQGREAARIAGLNVLAGVRAALGNLDRVECLIRSLNFVVAAEDFYDVQQVADGMTDLLADVFGPEAGYGCRATIGVQSLVRNLCFETWVEFGLRDDTE
ncbi:MAG: RidA family protein [Proteobacteria bacterium]|nr:RidA family protein [Pseudomonadota bacterium]